MKDLKTARWDVAQANQRVQQEFTSQYWAFLIAQVNYNEVTFDQATEQIVFAEYIPLTGLLNEVIEKVTQGTIAATQCAACQRYADMNKEDGIFGDTTNLERFICQACAQTLSAWDFYQQYLKLD